MALAMRQLMLYGSMHTLGPGAGQATEMKDLRGPGLAESLFMNHPCFPQVINDLLIVD